MFYLFIYPKGPYGRYIGVAMKKRTHCNIKNSNTQKNANTNTFMSKCIVSKKGYTKGAQQLSNPKNARVKK